VTRSKTGDSGDAEELIEQFPLTARVFIHQLMKTYEQKDKTYEEKEKHFKAKETISHMLTADANTRYLKVSGDLSLRRVLEEIERDDLFAAVKKSHKTKQAIAKIENNKVISNLSKKEIWSQVFEHSESEYRFPKLYSLNSKLPVTGLLADLFNFCSKEVHTYLPFKVFIDLDKYTPAQVMFSYFLLILYAFTLLKRPLSFYLY